MLSPYISKTEPPILMKLCMWPWYIPRKVYVKFQLILPTNKKFLLIAKRKAAGGRFSMRVHKMKNNFWQKVSNH